MCATRQSTRVRRQTGQNLPYEEGSKRPAPKAPGRVKRSERARHGDPRTPRSGLGAADGREEGRKGDDPPHLDAEEKYMCKKLGVGIDAIENDLAYLGHLNEFATLQELTNQLNESLTPSTVKPPVKADALRYLKPFADLISPGFSNQYCVQYERDPTSAASCDNVACSTNFREVPEVEKSNLIHVSPRQMYAIVTTVLGQVLEKGDELCGYIDWKLVSIESHLPVSVCKEFWWGFDTAHVKDGFNGCFVKADQRHNYETDKNYYRDFEVGVSGDRVQHSAAATQAARVHANKVLGGGRGCGDPAGAHSDRLGPPEEKRRAENMNLILVRPEDVREEGGELRVRITDKRRLTHIRYVLKADVGKELKLGVVNSTLDTATVAAVDPGVVTLRLSSAFRSHCPPPEPVVDLVVGLPRPKSLDKLLQYAASMGVARIKLVCSSRVELDYLKSHQLEPGSLEQSLVLGMEQGVTTFMPQVQLFKSLGALQRDLEKEGPSFRLIAHPGTPDTLASLGAAEHRSGPVMVAIGPEGGWVEHEVGFYEGLGFRKFNIGERILRAEVAAVAVLAQLQLLLSDPALRRGQPAAVRVGPGVGGPNEVI
ncbi:RNA methyltransferase, putative [Babesia caballi]|uniref:16S rRNA (uracil(1498)-N(3))-methyltransferase n=1 Tax=Babesia caballi TaxID=5871 RepID=A0AAV4LMH7_BABCB|nr:RNA methyltransferase, putative [Babesia caballi]